MSDILIDPNYYKHLDKAQLDQWISEFLSRNEAFRADVKELLQFEINEYINHETKLFEKYKVYLPLIFYINYKRSKRCILPDLIPVVLPFPVEQIRLFENESEYKEEINSLKEQSRLGSARHEKNIRLTKKWIEPNVKDLTDMYHLLGDLTSDGLILCKDRLILSIDMNNSKATITAEIENILKIHKPRKKVRLRDTDWKYYLIAYDMKKRHPEMTYNTISTKLSNAFSDSNNNKRSELKIASALFGAKNCENYYKAALKLIDGGYKNFI